MKQWRVVPSDGGWSLQWRDDGVWVEDRAFRDRDMALADLEWVQAHPDAA